MQADKVAAYEKAHGATGTINVVVTSCLPTVTGQQDRRKGFEQEVAKLNKTKPFQLKEIAFANTTTDPAKNLSNIQNLYTANGSKMQVAYAMCGPDTQNWGTVLQAAQNHNILVAGYDWLPQTLNLIDSGWVGWSHGQQPLQRGVLHLRQRCTSTSRTASRSRRASPTARAPTRRRPTSPRCARARTSSTPG